DDPNQNKWREEIRAALDRAKRLAEKRLPGKLSEQVIRAIENIQKSIP
ncbi:MAG: hypothetical protein HY253_12970, partial [Burkholderiales bacterium]|nr:hypothetical protein [Burkholderiales bacterium]